jgi:hypothetical protein
VDITIGINGNRSRVLKGSFCLEITQSAALTGNSITHTLWQFPMGWYGVKISKVLPITYRQTWLPTIPKFSSVKGTTLSEEEIDANFKVLQDEIVTWGETLEFARAIINNRFLRIIDVYADYTVTMEDAYNTLIRVHANAPTNIIIPPDSSVDFPIGSAILVSWNGNDDGVVTIAGQGGIEILTPDTFDIARRHGKVTVIKTEPYLWELEGNLAYEQQV